MTAHNILTGATFSWSISQTQLTENPAYSNLYIDMVSSIDWLSAAMTRKNFQLWKAVDYEVPLPTEKESGETTTTAARKLEGSYHHYDFPTAFLQSSHQYEEIPGLCKPNKNLTAV